MCTYITQNATILPKTMQAATGVFWHGSDLAARRSHSSPPAGSPRRSGSSAASGVLPPLSRRRSRLRRRERGRRACLFLACRTPAPAAQGGRGRQKCCPDMNHARFLRTFAVTDCRCLRWRNRIPLHTRSWFAVERLAATIQGIPCLTLHRVARVSSRASDRSPGALAVTGHRGAGEHPRGVAAPRRGGVVAG